MSWLDSLVQAKREIAAVAQLLSGDPEMRVHRERLPGALPPATPDVVPRIEGKASAGGYIQRHAAGISIPALVVVSLLAVLLLVVVGAAFLSLLESRDTAKGILVKVSTMVFFGAVLGLFVLVVGRKMLAEWMHSGELTVATWPLRPGSETHVRYRHGLRGAGKLVEAKALLACVETVSLRDREKSTVVSRSGRSRSEALGDVHPSKSADGSIDCAWTVRIPVDATPSFRGKRTGVAWQLIVDMKFEGAPDSSHEFELLVIPEVGP